MKNEEFRKEMHQYLDDQYDRLTEVQKGVAEIFQAFHKVCKENQIPYYVLYGSLIGIVRDGGFIPWDSDMDVALPIDEVPRLKKALKEQLPDQFFIVSEDDEDFPYTQLRVCRKGKPHDWYHLDVLYLVGAPEGPELEKYKQEITNMFTKRVKHMYYLDMKKRTNLGRIEKFTKLYYGLRFGHMNVAGYNKKFWALTHKYPYKDAKTLVCFDSMKNSVAKDLLEPPKFVQTSIGEACVPHDEIKYLNTIYTDYKEVLPIGQRFHEFYDYAYRSSQEEESSVDYYIPQ